MLVVGLGHQQARTDGSLPRARWVTGEERPPNVRPTVRPWGVSDWRPINENGTLIQTETLNGIQYE
jgi:hypothetical protein